MEVVKALGFVVFLVIMVLISIWAVTGKIKECMSSPSCDGPAIICIDFDGVLHSFKSGWCGIGEIPDPPVSGAISWLKDLIKFQGFRICIWSSRNWSWRGTVAMRKWLLDNGMAPDEVRSLYFPVMKPNAHITIDDRAYRFEGYFPSPAWIIKFRPWHERNGIPMTGAIKENIGSKNNGWQ